MNTLLVSGEEVCRRLGISRQVFYRMRKAGSLPGPLEGSRQFSWPQVAVAVGLAPDMPEPSKPAQRRGRK